MKFLSPIAEALVTNGWGFSRGTYNDGRPRIHQGLDFRAKVGTSVVAVADGKVVISQDTGNLTGIWIAIQHAEGFVSRYMHLSKRLVKVGDVVKAGQVIAKSGDTAIFNSEPHLHFDLQTTSPDSFNLPKGTKYSTGTAIPSEPFIPAKYTSTALKMIKKLGIPLPAAIAGGAVLAIGAIIGVVWWLRS